MSDKKYVVLQDQGRYTKSIVLQTDDLFEAASKHMTSDGNTSVYKLIAFQVTEVVETGIDMGAK